MDSPLPRNQVLFSPTLLGVAAAALFCIGLYQLWLEITD